MLKSWTSAAQNGTFRGHRTVADTVRLVKEAPCCSRSLMRPCPCDRKDKLQHTESSKQQCPCDGEDRLRHTESSKQQCPCDGEDRLRHTESSKQQCPCDGEDRLRHTESSKQQCPCDGEDRLRHTESSKQQCPCDGEDRLRHTESSKHPCPCDGEDRLRHAEGSRLRGSEAGGKRCVCGPRAAGNAEAGSQEGSVSPSRPCRHLQARSPNPACETAGIHCFKPIRLESFVLAAPKASHSSALSTGSVSAGKVGRPHRGTAAGPCKTQGGRASMSEGRRQMPQGITSCMLHLDGKTQKPLPTAGSAD
ncbi:uncharacterized protein LOC124906621 [Homo sapiens]|uniref:uncharacterized protein LOC124906621 n=1 Tax=Homo sapiens TaxID=9606 RepID=UPI000D0C85FF|nr:uncharacterized protein LOC124906621 [Homo sapiens]|eukprot:XP_024302816.1 uncharacterized protein LOC112268013 [Homo sapiens]